MTNQEHYNSITYWKYSLVQNQVRIIRIIVLPTGSKYH